MVQLSTGCPFPLSVGVHFPVPSSGHYNEGPVPQVPFQIHPSGETKDVYTSLAPLSTQATPKRVFFLSFSQGHPSERPEGEEHGQGT